VRRGLAELEAAGLAQRKGSKKGEVEIYSWAVPRSPQEENGSHARLPFPGWFPREWAALKPLIIRLRRELSISEGDVRDYLNEGAEVSLDYQNSLEAVMRFLERVCAPPRIYKEERTEILKEKDPPPPPFVNGSNGNTPEPAKAEDEEDGSLYQQFKTSYPGTRFDEAKAKPAFEALKHDRQKLALVRLRDAYLKCPRWQDQDGKWIPLASNFLKGSYFECDPPPLLQTSGNGPKKLASMEEVLKLVEGGTG
jgi:hypothetical protein